MAAVVDVKYRWSALTSPSGWLGKKKKKERVGYIGGGKADECHGSDNEDDEGSGSVDGLLDVMRGRIYETQRNEIVLV